MKFWLYVNNEQNSVVKGDRVPYVGETVIYRDPHRSALDEGIVESIKTEVIGNSTNIDSPVETVCHVYVRPKE